MHLNSKYLGYAVVGTRRDDESNVAEHGVWGKYDESDFNIVHKPRLTPRSSLYTGPTTKLYTSRSKLSGGSFFKSMIAPKAFRKKNQFFFHRHI